MKEPYLLNPAGEQVPYSQVPTEVLQQINVIPCVVRDPDQQDQAFNTSYAARIVQERGH